MIITRWDGSPDNATWARALCKCWLFLLNSHLLERQDILCHQSLGLQEFLRKSEESVFMRETHQTKNYGTTFYVLGLINLFTPRRKSSVVLLLFPHPCCFSPVEYNCLCWAQASLTYYLPASGGCMVMYNICAAE